MYLHCSFEPYQLSQRASAMDKNFFGVYKFKYISEYYAIKQKAFKIYLYPPEYFESLLIPFLVIVTLTLKKYIYLFMLLLSCAIWEVKPHIGFNAKGVRYPENGGPFYNDRSPISASLR